MNADVSEYGRDLVGIGERIIARGWFPKELPPTFTTQSASPFAREILASWRSSEILRVEQKTYKKAGKKYPLRGRYTYKLTPTEPESVSAPKRGYERRTLHLTHPLPQVALAFEIEDHWQTIGKWLGRQRYSIDKIRTSDHSDRGIAGINFGAHKQKKAFIEASSDWIVQTDISRFYPSIYTHSIPWASYGKKKVKGDVNQFAGTIADRLDILVRSCNRNQTIGIPIGPETSRVLADIISGAIDQHLSDVEKVRTDKADRLQDDWLIGSRSLEDGERYLSTLIKAYRQYGLEINGSKTSIEHIIAERSNDWAAELGAFLTHNRSQLSGQRLLEFLALSVRLQRANTKSPVVSYALSVIENTTVSMIDSVRVESYLLEAAVIAPNALDKICRILINMDRRARTISRTRVGNRFNEIMEAQLEKGNQFEALWCLHTLRGIRRPVRERRVVDLIASQTGSIFPIVALDMRSRNLLIGSLPSHNWEDAITETSVRTNSNWLLAYEGIRNGWLRDRRNVMDGPFFRPLRDNNVLFYDRTKNVDASRAAVRRRRLRSAEMRLLTRSLVRSLRNMNDESGI